VTKIYGNVLRWKAAWYRSHGLPPIPGRSPLPIRFIFGVGRSGTTWLGRVLGEAQQPICYLQEPLTYARPFYAFSDRHDRLALPPMARMSKGHPLAILCRDVARLRNDYGRLLGRYAAQKVIRNDCDAELVLIKEVHALLAAPALTAALDAKAVAISRHPVYVVDSLLSYQDLSVGIWRNEQRLVRDGAFLASVAGALADRVRDALDRFPDDGVNRTNTIVGKALTTALISKHLELAADRSPDILHLAYRDLCRNPLEGFSRAARHLDLTLGERGSRFIAETTSPRADDDHPTQTVHKDTSNQAHRPLKSLTREEADLICRVLSDLDLLNDETGLPS